MAFSRVRIQPDGQGLIQVLFNPTEYRLEQGNQIVEQGIPGLQAPVLQFVHGNSRTLSMELFLDTYEEQKDVREHSDKIYGLLTIDPETHAPPICTVSWGGFRFRGVMDRVSGSFTLFLADGTPVRARLAVTFKEYIEVKVLVRQNPTRSADHRKSRTVRAGDTLPSIAYEEYGSATKWRPIAEENEVDDPFRLQPGTRLVIPQLV